MGKRRRKTKQTAEGYCAYCEKWFDKLTEDHVTPQCLYGNKVPADIPIVFACANCNGDLKSKDDTWLRDVLLLDIDAFDQPVVREIYEGSFKRSVGYGNASPAVGAALNAVPLSIPVFTPSGIYVGPAYGVSLPAGRMATTMSRIVRGLYLAYADTWLPQDADVEIQRVRDRQRLNMARQVLQAKSAPSERVGDGSVFSCVYWVEPDNPRQSSWLLTFYKEVTFAVYTA